MVSGRTAMVTGAARGIGAAIAVALAREGADVILLDLGSTESVARTIRSNGGTALEYAGDVSDPDQVEKIVHDAQRQTGGIDILVNNAGIITRGTILDTTYEEWNRVLSVNVNGTFNCCKAVLPAMIERKDGRIVNITSVAGKVGDITAGPAYGTSKGGINALTKSLARQLAVYGIRVNAVAPHAISTEMSDQWSEEKRRSVIADIPLHRLGTPEDVAEATVYLASDRAAFITGEILDVNGGFLMD